MNYKAPVCKNCILSNGVEITPGHGTCLSNSPCSAGLHELSLLTGPTLTPVLTAETEFLSKGHNIIILAGTQT